MTVTYWEIGRRIVEHEQGGAARAKYGGGLLGLLERLASDLQSRFGRGFSYPNLNTFRQFYLAFPPEEILSTPSIESPAPTATVWRTTVHSVDIGKLRQVVRP
jgi:hypothetical protein